MSKLNISCYGLKILCNEKNYNNISKYKYKYMKFINENPRILQKYIDVCVAIKNQQIDNQQGGGALSIVSGFFGGFTFGAISTVIAYLIYKYYKLRQLVKNKTGICNGEFTLTEYSDKNKEQLTDDILAIIFTKKLSDILSNNEKTNKIVNIIFKLTILQHKFEKISNSIFNNDELAKTNYIKEVGLTDHINIVLPYLSVINYSVKFLFKVIVSGLTIIIKIMEKLKKFDDETNNKTNILTKEMLYNILNIQFKNGIFCVKQNVENIMKNKKYEKSREEINELIFDLYNELKQYIKNIIPLFYPNIQKYISKLEYIITFKSIEKIINKNTIDYMIHLYDTIYEKNKLIDMHEIFTDTNKIKDMIILMFKTTNKNTTILEIEIDVLAHIIYKTLTLSYIFLYILKLKYEPTTTSIAPAPAPAPTTHGELR